MTAERRSRMFSNTVFPQFNQDKTEQEKLMSAVSSDTSAMRNASGGGTGTSPFQLFMKKRVLSKLVPITLVVLFTYNSVYNSSIGLYRQLQDENNGLGKVNGRYKYCRTPYVLMDHLMATMPSIAPQEERMDPPSHIQLCQAYINRHDLEKSKIEELPAIKVVEDPAICVDWSSPHYSVMHIFASSLIAAKGLDYGLKYNHDCHKFISRTRQSDQTHYDYTTAQEVLPENLISTNDANSVDESLVESLCRGCISQHSAGKLPTHGGVAHHCFLFPGGAASDSIVEENKEIPMASILSSFVDRMRHLTEDWIDATDALDFEDESGVIVGLDEKSTFMNMEYYDGVIPPQPTSIQILASANCAMASLQKTSDCIEHGRALKAYFKNRFPPPTYVRYDIVASTATSFSRMMNAKILVCPPGTITCLLPALGKLAGKKAFVAEDGERPTTYHWFEHMLAKRKSLGLQNLGFDAVADEDYLVISEETSAKMSSDLPLDELDGAKNDEYTMVTPSLASKTRSHSFGPISSYSNGEPMDTQEPEKEETIVDFANIITTNEESELDETTTSLASPTQPEAVEESEETGASVYSSEPEELVEDKNDGPIETSVPDEMPDEPAYYENAAYGRGSIPLDTNTPHITTSESERVSDSSEKELVTVYDFWHSVFKDHTFHLDSPWNGEDKGVPQYLVYSEHVEGTQPVFAFWNDENREFTSHMGEPWVGEIRSAQKPEALFYAFAANLEGLELEPVYSFWHDDFKSHSFHMGDPWSGENEHDGVAFYAFPVPV